MNVMAFSLRRKVETSRYLLTDREPLTLAEVGGKLARQATMARAGLPVPRFFCLTRAAFDRALGSARAELAAVLQAIDFDDAESLRSGAERARAHILNLTLDADLGRQVLDTFDALFGEDALVAVRASTVGDRLD